MCAAERLSNDMAQSRILNGHQNVQPVLDAQLSNFRILAEDQKMPMINLTQIIVKEKIRQQTSALAGVSFV